VEIGGKRVLFDTGDDPGILAKNVKAKGIDLARLDLGVGANPRAGSDRRAPDVLSEGDLRDYRALLAQSDDFEGGGSGAVGF
jgi:hypothetical protein